MTLLLLHLILCSFMTGVIWIIQVVHYPLFANVGEEGYATYQRLHMRKITWVVMPMMLLELLTAVLLIWPAMLGLEDLAENIHGTGWLWFNLGALSLVWASTMLLQVPQHNTLRLGFEGIAHSRLVRWNWIRTIIWSVRVFVLLYLVMSV